MHRIPDSELVEKGIRKDNRGRWYNKATSETKHIYKLDEATGEDWTKEEPLSNEPYQKWDEAKKAFIVDTEKKVKAEKDQLLAEKQAEIEAAENRIQRSLRAKLAGEATAEDEKYFTSINAEIHKLRAEKQQLIA
jgi:hypothetical protein